MYVKARLKYTKYKSSTRITRNAAKAIVKKAGPLDKRAFADTDRSLTIMSPRTWIAPGAAAATGNTNIGLFSSADWEDNATVGRETTQVKSLEFRTTWDGLSFVTDTDFCRRDIFWWIVKGDNDDLAAMQAQAATPWNGVASLDYMNNFANVYTIRRGRFPLWQFGTNTQRANPQLTYRDKMIVRMRKPFWMKESESIRFFYMWGTTVKAGLPAALPGVTGSIDTLIRHARY